MENQTRSSRHYKFISAENITILSVSSDDFLHAFLEVEEQQMWLLIISAVVILDILLNLISTEIVK